METPRTGKLSDMADVPHIALPIRYVNGHITTVEQDSNADIEQCIEVICSYIKGDREEAPEFGISDQTFREGGIDANVLKQEIEELEPRANTLLEGDWDFDNLIENIRTQNTT